MAEKENKNKHVITIKVEGPKWDEAMDKAFDKKVKDVKVDGFRQGHVPREIYEKKFGKESLFMDAADSVLQDAYMEAIESSKLVPVLQPEVNLSSITETGVEFAFTIITKPAVVVKKYKGLKIAKEKVEVTEAEIAEEIGKLTKKYTELELKDGAVENGDLAIIDFEGFNDGVAFDGGKGENYSLEIGSNTFIPGFEEQVIGLKAGEDKDINVVFPDDYPQEELKGKAVVFKIHVNEVKEKIERELDAEFFEDLGMEGVNSKETLEAEIKLNINARKDMDAENKYVNSILDAVGKQVEVEIPDEMVNEEVDRLMGRFEENMKMQGISLDVYYQFTKSTETDLRNNMEHEAFKNVLYRLMLEEIVKQEQIVVSLEETNKEADNLAEKYKMEKEEFLKLFGGLDMITYDLEMRKVIEFLKENNK